jgi:hypothetical protein
MDPSVTDPARFSPYRPDGAPGSYETSLQLEATLDRTWVQLIATALDPDGQRVVVGGLSGPVTQPVRRVTVWEYLTTR